MAWCVPRRTWCIIFYNRCIPVVSLLSETVYPRCPCSIHEHEDRWRIELGTRNYGCSAVGGWGIALKLHLVRGECAARHSANQRRTHVDVEALCLLCVRVTLRYWGKKKAACCCVADPYRIQVPAEGIRPRACGDKPWLGCTTVISLGMLSYGFVQLITGNARRHTATNVKSKHTPTNLCFPLLVNCTTKTNGSMLPALWKYYTHQRVFHVLEVCGVIGAHKQALANHVFASGSLKAMSASVHEAEVLLNAAPTVIDPEDPDVRKTCLPDDEPRVEAIGERIQGAFRRNVCMLCACQRTGRTSSTNE